MYQIEVLKLKIYDIVDANLSNPKLNGVFIATQLGVNRMYLHRKLVEIYQQNARDYIRMIRLNRAEKLLIETNDSIKIIAQEVGYQDSSFFTKNFKRYRGTTPTKYRKLFG